MFRVPFGDVCLYLSASNDPLTLYICSVRDTQNGRRTKQPDGGGT